MLRWRIATALILAPVVLGALLLGRWTVLALVLVVVALAAYELSQALNPLPFTAALGAGIFPVALTVPFGAGGVLGGVVLVLPWTLLCLAGRPEARTLRALLALMLMALWVGAPMAMAALIVRAEDGVILILIAVVGPWVSDSGAYFAGRLFGRHAMFPSLSPKKTIEGGLGGLVLTMGAVGVVGYYALGLSPLQAVLAGALVSVFSQSGDLFESLLKRMMEIKDLGNTLPGHGGMLDRIDSLLFTAPAVYYIFLLV
ncbi:phosphatidate cytidylyltransferase [Rubrobacter aplysinae]|uniref:phosphatidate cytidylyltransferase n=1 Tax=Rubrobacter aplysinae TaxID=909625 RepID=UPI00069E01A7|nr:phosphatidate cytidylyltransferase [Rubrobacter aplysinae]